MKFNSLKTIQEVLRNTGRHKHVIEFYKDGKDMNKPTQIFTLNTFSASVFLANNLQNNYIANETSDGVITCKAKKPKKHIFIVK